MCDVLRNLTFNRRLRSQESRLRILYEISQKEQTM
jgi:hypothetical protein